MAEAVEIIRLEDRAGWTAAQAEHPLPSQSWHYADALAASGLQPRLAVVRAGSSRMTLVFLVRDWHGAIDVATVYGLSGAWLDPPSEAPLQVWSEFAKKQGWVAGYLQISPYSPLQSCKSGRLVEHNAVFLLDLAGDDPLRSASRTTHRKIALAETLGASLVEDRSALSARLLELFPETLARLGIGAPASLSAETWARWMKDPASLLIGASLDGRIVAAYLFLVAGRYAESHMLGYEDRGRDLTAWLIASAMPRLRARGVTTLDLGGGVQVGDGVYEFKSRFGGRRSPLQSVRQIYDPTRYDALCRDRNVATDGGGWFPAYRAPTAA